MRMTIFKAGMLVATISFGATLQAQDYEGYIGWNFMLKAPMDAPKRYCLDLEGYAFITDTSAPAIVHSCKEGFWKDGTWMVDYPQPGQIYLPDYELCIAAESLQEGANVILETCSDESLQQFVFRDDEKVEVRSDSSEKFCLAVGETSRPTGGNLRRETRIASCDETDEQYTQWILRREDTVYPTISALEGNAGEALNMLEKAIASGWTRHWYAGRDPNLESLRNDIRFQSLIADVRNDMDRLRLELESVASHSKSTQQWDRPLRL